MFGLADLHQMRGRVGRSNKDAYCYLLTPPPASLTPDARRRLKTLEEFSDLGEGFQVAMRDLDIRGAGDIFGSEQSGFITDMGFDAYHKILDETIQELKETEFKDLFKHEINIKKLVSDCVIETDMEIIIPDTYVSNTSERLQLYTELDNLKNEEELQHFRQSLIDRFGPLPQPVKEMLLTVRLRWVGEKAGFEKISLRGGKLRGYFVPPENKAYFQSEIFGNILQYVQLYPRKVRLKYIKGKPMLIIDEVESVQQATDHLQEATGQPVLKAG